MKPTTTIIRTATASAVMLSTLLYPARAVEDKNTAQSVLGIQTTAESKSLAPAPEFINVRDLPVLSAR